MSLVDRPKSFIELVGYTPQGGIPPKFDIHGTTILSLKHKEGVYMIADRRATMGNLIMYERAEKIFALDDSTVIALSGSFARSLEICRLLRHSFQYYRRTQLGEMSTEGKLQEISKALAANLPQAMSGVGIFVPIVATYDKATGEFDTYFFDPAGARFDNDEFACAGSGSERIRGIFDYIRQTKGPFEKRKNAEVLEEGLRMLQIAAALDSATGGIGENLPIVFDLTASGARQLTAEEVGAAVNAIEKAAKA